MSHRPSTRAWSALPRWRRARFGWVLLHVVFGLGMLGLAQVVGTGMFILAVEEGDRSFRGDVVAWASLGLAVATGLAAWLLFVYLRRSRRARWATFLGLLVGGFALNLGGQLLAERVLSS